VPNLSHMRGDYLRVVHATEDGEPYAHRDTNREGRTVRSERQGKNLSVEGGTFQERSRA